MFILESREPHEENSFLFAGETLPEVTAVAHDAIENGDSDKFPVYIDLADSLEIFKVDGFKKEIVATYDLRERRVETIAQLRAIVEAKHSQK